VDACVRRRLKPLLVVLGGVREVGPRGQHGEERKACRRFIKNTYARLNRVWISTPLGHVTVGSLEEDLHEFREELYEQAVVLNRKNKYWQILVELAWTRLDEDAESTLLALVEKMPEEFWE